MNVCSRNAGCFAVRLAVPLVLLLAAPVRQLAQQPFQISVDVDVVSLQASVHDRKGRLDSALREQDFSVFEDGARQTIRLFRHEDVPVTIGLVVDHSGSMARKIPEVVLAAKTFVRSSNPEDEMFVVNFNEHVQFGLPEGSAFTNRAKDLEAAILNAPVAGQTALYDAVLSAQERLLSGSRARKVLVVISDGADNASVHSRDEALKAAGLSKALIYTIGIFEDGSQDKNPDILRRFARTTGGEAFFPAHLDQVVPICEQIAREIRSQYTIEYVSTNPTHSQAWRNIRVTASGAGADLVVRTRTGYYPRGSTK
jgi:VWFA-related protein